MNAMLIETNANAEISEVRGEREAQVEALKELSECELAYVGGGTAMVSFI